MALINEHYLKLKSGYLFPEIARRVQAFTEANPEAKIIRLGIGDVTQPLPPAVIDTAVPGIALHQAYHGHEYRDETHQKKNNAHDRHHIPHLVGTDPHECSGLMIVLICDRPDAYAL